MSYWRDCARRVIAAALQDGRRQGLEGTALERFVAGRYPFDEYSGHAAQVWRDELRSGLGTRRPRPVGDPHQVRLFEAEAGDDAAR